MVVFIDLALVQDRILFINIPQKDLTVHGATCKDDWLGRVERDLSDAVGHFDVECGLLSVEGTPEWVENTDHRRALTPADMICAPVRHCQG